MNQKTQEIVDRYIIALDEINETIETEYNSLDGKSKSTVTSEMQDLVETLMIQAYKQGREDFEDMLDYVLETELDLELLSEALGQEYDGKTYGDRVSEYVAGENVGSISRVAETEFHRMYGQGALDAAIQYEEETGREVKKTWVAILDDRTRDRHAYLDGKTVGIDEKFRTYDDYTARFPGDFEIVELNANCRCWVEYGI